MLYFIDCIDLWDAHVTKKGPITIPLEKRRGKDWKEIIYELDHSEFLVKDRQGLILLIKALELGFQVQGFRGPFPVDMFYRQWKYSDGQVSLLQQILRYPDIFNFADHHHHPVAVEVLKGKFSDAVKVLKQI